MSAEHFSDESELDFSPPPYTDCGFSIQQGKRVRHIILDGVYVEFEIAPNFYHAAEALGEKYYQWSETKQWQTSN